MIIGQAAAIVSCTVARSGFSDEQMALVKHAGKFISPANDLCLAAGRGFHLGHQCIHTAYGHGEIHAQFSEAVREFRGAASGSVYHV